MRNKGLHALRLATLMLFASFAIAQAQKPAEQAPEDLKSLIEKRQKAHRALDDALATASNLRAEALAADVRLIQSWLPDLTDKAAIEKAIRTDPIASRLVHEMNRNRALVESSKKAVDNEEIESTNRRQNDLLGFEQTFRQRVAQVATDQERVAVPAPVAKEVARLAEAVKKHPARPSNYISRLGVYMLDLEKGDVTLVADEPDPKYTYVSTPEWSRNGKRIVFDAIPYPANVYSRTRVKALEFTQDELVIKDLGPGYSPTCTPNADRVVFLLERGAVPGADGGVWIMEADGQERRALGKFGRPTLSPDGRRLMLYRSGGPLSIVNISIIDVTTGDQHNLKYEGQSIVSMPSWADNNTIVTVTRSSTGDSVVLLDVTNPAQTTLKETLWKRGDGSDIEPAHPAYSTATNLCVFCGWSSQGMSIYSIKSGQTGPPQPLKAVGHSITVATPTFSPDGRFLLFCSDVPNPKGK